MKKITRITAIVVLLVGLASVPAVTFAQEVSVSADIVSSYVWRGAKFGDGAAVQPGIEFCAGGFAVGAWGSFDLANDIDSEADLYLGYGFDFGLYVGLTDYFFPSYEGDSHEYLDGDNHTIEANVGYEIGAFSISANMYIDDNSNDDVYFELGYSFGPASIFVGGGNESYTADTDFAICNLGITAEKEIEITDSYSLPVFASFIVNPDIEQTYMVFGVSF